MKIIVLGGSGFIGSHVADSLSKRGHKVTIFDKKNQNG
jgi:UDP-glucose 4-epimerase